MIQPNGIWDINTAIWGHVHSLALASALNDVLPKESTVLELGCGIGFYSLYLKRKGHTVLSYEGTPDIDSIALIDNIATVDLSKNVDFPFTGEVISLEVGEHIPLHFEDVYIHNITKVANKKLITSWAVPGQGGDGHVNCRDNDYIIWKIEQKGFKYNKEQSNYLRDHASNCSWFSKTIMAFDRVGTN